ncbi:hypothetical protein BT96DRAFT_1004998 [Gymnopus androsaceus JB14]|uniref:Uncharacterized protein n=1 Tax=Gymnopus androsaceus JB14 TaxID=1447944 RepID=A0A6A4GQB6_9AGAR|nr:hypothetical protein BT96DRAFT_1004998 [Gymnopus androsaceus JB14]
MDIRQCNASTNPLTPDGCLQMFPNKHYPGKCLGCQAVDAAAEDEKENTRSLLQCTGCGIQAIQLPYSDPIYCGPCYDFARNIPMQSIDPSLSASTHLRMCKQGPPPPSQGCLATAPVQPTIPLTTVAMDQVKTTAQTPAEHIYINIQPFVNCRAVRRAGGQMKTVPMNTSLKELYTEFLTHVNSSQKPPVP